MLPPSGADLVAQWQGGVGLIVPSNESFLNVWPFFDWSLLIVFSATAQPGRKVQTHRHLDDLAGLGLLDSKSELPLRLQKILNSGISAIREGRPVELGRALDDYADALLSVGLEVEKTTQDRRFLRGLPGVLGVKGAGALQADSILVLMEPGQSLSSRENVIRAAQERGLRQVSNGVVDQMGVKCEIN